MCHCWYQIEAAALLPQCCLRLRVPLPVRYLQRITRQSCWDVWTCCSAVRQDGILWQRHSSLGHKAWESLSVHTVNCTLLSHLYPRYFVLLVYYPSPLTRLPLRGIYCCGKLSSPFVENQCLPPFINWASSRVVLSSFLFGI